MAESTAANPMCTERASGFAWLSSGGTRSGAGHGLVSVRCVLCPTLGQLGAAFGAEVGGSTSACDRFLALRPVRARVARISGVHQPSRDTRPDQKEQVEVTRCGSLVARGARRGEASYLTAASSPSFRSEDPITSRCMSKRAASDVGTSTCTEILVPPPAAGSRYH
jgi:hypothetical protein